MSCYKVIMETGIEKSVVNFAFPIVELIEMKYRK